jgi:hypothetical protein
LYRSQRMATACLCPARPDAPRLRRTKWCCRRGDSSLVKHWRYDGRQWNSAGLPRPAGGDAGQRANRVRLAGRGALAGAPS